MSLVKSWFDHTFTSRAKTEELLRPDLESGLLSQHDYDLAVAFLPGYHRYLPYAHCALWGAASGLAIWRFKLKFRFPYAIMGASSLAGYGVGVSEYFRRHKNFTRQLDDRQAFPLVLENVNKRMGNAQPLFPSLDRNKMLDDIMKRKHEHGEVLSPGAELLGDTSSAPPERTPFAAPETPDAPTEASDGAAAATARPKGAWDAIREANAQRTGKHSTWDELRERHERQRVSERVPVQQRASEAEDPRAKAQAEFDAILEAERRAARG